MGLDKVTYDDLVGIQFQLVPTARRASVAAWVHRDERPSCTCARCRLCALADLLYPEDGAEPPAWVIDAALAALRELVP